MNLILFLLDLSPTPRKLIFENVVVNSKTNTSQVPFHSFFYFIHSFIYSFIHSFIHLFIHLFIHSFICEDMFSSPVSISLVQWQLKFVQFFPSNHSSVLFQFIVVCHHVCHIPIVLPHHFLPSIFSLISPAIITLHLYSRNFIMFSVNVPLP